MRRATVKNGNFSLFLVLQLLEYFVPIWAASVCAGLEACDQVPFFLKSKIYSNFYFIFLIFFIFVQTFSWSKSRASCSPTAFMSVFCNALVMYICISRNLSMAPPSSACSISSWESRFTNHSKDLWSRLIQKKSTYNLITQNYEDKLRGLVCLGSGCRVTESEQKFRCRCCSFG